MERTTASGGGEVGGALEPVRILFSAAWQKNIEVSELPDPAMEVTLRHRRMDWGLTEAGRMLAYLADSWALARNQDRFDVTVVSSAGIESFLTPILWRLFNRRDRSLVLLDVIPLGRRSLDRFFAPFLRAVDLVVCIRTGDVAMMGRRFGVPAAACRFVPMPCPVLEDEGAAAGEAEGLPSAYVYSAGSAHRNWPLLLQALRDVPHPSVIATQSDLGDAAGDGNLTLLPAQSIEEGRALLAHASVLAMAFQDTDLACGPTVVLDALALGIPVVATDTNACRDYVVDGETGLLSDPGSPAALAENICRIMEDGDLRARLGRQARSYARAELGRPLFEERLVDALRSVRGYATRLVSPDH